MGATGGFCEMVSFAFAGAAGNLEPEEEGTLGIDLDGLGAGAGAGGGEDFNCGVPGDFSSCSTSNPSTPRTKAPTSQCKAF